MSFVSHTSFRPTASLDKVDGVIEACRASGNPLSAAHARAFHDMRGAVDDGTAEARLARWDPHQLFVAPHVCWVDVLAAYAFQHILQELAHLARKNNDIAANGPGFSGGSVALLSSCFFLDRSLSLSLFLELSLSLILFHSHHHLSLSVTRSLSTLNSHAFDCHSLYSHYHVTMSDAISGEPRFLFHPCFFCFLRENDDSSAANGPGVSGAVLFPILTRTILYSRSLSLALSDASLSLSLWTGTVSLPLSTRTLA